MDTLLDLYRKAPYDTFEAIMMCNECSSDGTVIDAVMQPNSNIDLCVNCGDCGTLRHLSEVEARIVEDFLGL